MSAINFISIQRRARDGGRDVIDTSTLVQYARDPRWITVAGVLPHSADWRPASARDRDALVSWLESLQYEEG